MINAQTRLCLLLGNPVKHSLSPTMHNSGFKALSLNYAYLAAHVEEKRIGAAVEALRALSIAGANVTSPFKDAVIPFLDSVSAEAETIRSVNTIINREGSLHGLTTDGPGFCRSLKQAVSGYKIEQPCMIIGAGGAARAVAYSLAREGAGEMYITNRSRGKAESLACLIRSQTQLKLCTAVPLDAEALLPLLPHCRLFVYSLPTDHREFIEALAESGIPFGDSLLFDLRYSPAESAVMKSFSQSGGKAFNGLGMLFWQAVIAFEEFTGQKAPLAAMRKAVEL